MILEDTQVIVAVFPWLEILANTGRSNSVVANGAPETCTNTSTSEEASLTEQVEYTDPTITTIVIVKECKQLATK